MSCPSRTPNVTATSVGGVGPELTAFVHLLDQGAGWLERVAQHVGGDCGDGLPAPGHGEERADAVREVFFLQGGLVFPCDQKPNRCAVVEVEFL